MKNKNKQTKFPVARIKKIMQKDEEVGKVAQATPIVISKALELFLAMIIEESSKVTVARGAKKVEAYHLKHAVETTEIFDFLKEIVESVPDPSAGGTINLEAENAEAAAKRKRGKGKKSGDTEGGGRKRRKKKGEEESGPDGGDAVEAEADADEEEEDGMDDDEKPGPSSGSGPSGWKKRPSEAAWREDAPFIPR